jgi:hypothetical protein
MPAGAAFASLYPERPEPFPHRPVDELLDVAVERPVLDQLEVEVGRLLEDRFRSGLAGDPALSANCRT